jgi:hypothetical protein
MAALALGAAVFVEHPSSGGCLDVWYEERDAGSQIGLWRCVAGATPSQRFTLPAVGDTAQLKVYGTLCLQDRAGTGAIGGQIIQQVCSTSSRAQRWTLTSAGEVKNVASGACLTASGDPTGMTPVLLGTCGTPGARWRPATEPGVPVALVAPAAALVPPAVFVRSVPAGNCLDVWYEERDAGSQIGLYRCVAGATPSQRFTLPAVGDTAQLKVYGTLCLQDRAGTGAIGGQIIQQVCSTSSRAQRWTLTSAGEVKNVASGACLGTAGNAVAEMTPAVIVACSAPSARWIGTDTPEPEAISPPVTASPIGSGTQPLSEPVRPSGPEAAVPSAAPELPRTTVDTRMPTPTGRTIAVPAGGDLQAAFVAARPGDVITLANGATYRGNFELPDKAAGGWIVVRPASLSGLPAEGERLAPVRHAAQMPKIVSPNAMFAISTPDRNANTGTRGWRFVGIEIASNESVAIAQAIVQLGEGNETSLGKVPSHIVLDRVWIHGRPQQYVSRCLTLNSAHTAVIDSYLSECHTRGGEGQVIGGWGSPGPLRIENNYLEGGTIGMLVGGADPNIQGLIPSDITVRRNHFFKPLAWKGVYQVKNSFELKNAQRVLVEGNVFENNWQDAQSGYMILFTPLSQANLAPWTTVRDVTFRNNLLRNSDQGFMIAARNAYTSAGLAPVQLNEVTKRVLIENNVLDRVGGRAFMVYNETEDVTIAHNVSNGADFGFLLLGDSTKAPAARLVLRDNLMSRGYTLINGDGTGQGSIALSAYARGAVVAGNLVYSSIEPGLGRVNLFPTSNNFVELPALAGITSATILGAPVANAQVTLGSLFYRSGTGGSTPGANLTALNAAIANVVQR